MTKFFDDCVPATGFFLYTNYRLHVCAPPARTSSTTGLPEPSTEHSGYAGQGQLNGRRRRRSYFAASAQSTLAHHE